MISPSDYLKRVGLTPERLADDPALARTTTIGLLNARGVTNPSDTVVQQVQRELGTTEWQRFAGSAPRPKRLTEYVAADAVPELLSSPEKLKDLSLSVLRGLGVATPSAAQVGQLQATLIDQFKNDTWRGFTPTVSLKPVDQRGDVSMFDSIMFGEHTVFSEAELTVEALQMSTSHLAGLGDFESGRVGMLMAATFINKSSRANGNFSEAYGDQAWNGFVAAHTMLEQIPRGEFLERLDTSLMSEVNRLIHAPDEGFVAVLKRAVHSIMMGREDKGGRLREGTGFASLYSFNEKQYQAVLQSGVAIHETPASTEGKRKGFLRYPAPETIPTRLKEIVAELRTALSKPDADPIDAAAQFQRSFVALHPYEDSNGRTSRLLMNRILAEFNLPPAVYRDQNGDISCTPAEWRRETAEGIARSRAFLTSQGRFSFADYLSQNGVQLIENVSRSTHVVAGQPFDLGADGMLYSITGRPHLVLGGEVVPLSQMEAYVLARRVFSREKTDAWETMSLITDETRSAVSDPATQASLKRVSEKHAWNSDVAFKLAPHPKVAALLCDIIDVKKIDPARLFRVEGAHGTKAAQVMSMYTQLDLELWHVEKSLSGDKGLQKKIRGERDKLFTMAETALLQQMNLANSSEKNPMGFKYEYERKMFEVSPLRFSSLKEAIKRDGDDQVVVWRGDYGFAKWLGMAPNNDVREKSARQTSKERASRGVVGHMIQELNRLEGNAGESQYVCATSDLSLLAQQFAEENNTKPLDLAKLSPFLRPVVMTSIRALTTVDKSNASRRTMSDFLKVPGRILDVNTSTEGSVNLTAYRKAFKLRLDKASLLPGIRAIGPQEFSEEQEIHGLDRVSPLEILETFQHTELWREIDTLGDAGPVPKTAPKRMEK